MHETFMSEEEIEQKPQRLPQELELDTKLPCGLSRREIFQMKRAGMEKPDFVTWADWNGPRKLSHRHMLVAHLAALGYSNKDIARATLISQQRVGALVNSNALRDVIQQIREIELQGVGIDQKLGQLSSQAIRVYEQTLFDPTVKLQQRLEVAHHVLDRKLGKPQQRVEVRGSLIGELYEMLKQRDQSPTAIAADSMPLTEDAFFPDAEDFDDAIAIEPINPVEPEIDPVAEASAKAAEWIDREFKS